MLGRARAEGRADDRPETIRERLRVYREKTEPLVGFYRESGTSSPTSTASGSVAEVAARVDEALAAVRRAAGSRRDHDPQPRRAPEARGGLARSSSRRSTCVEKAVAPGRHDRRARPDRRGRDPRARGRGRPSSATAATRRRSAPRSTTRSCTASPGKRTLDEGDVVGIDCGAVVDGYFGDAARTVPVGRIAPEAARLLEVDAGGARRPGSRRRGRAAGSPTSAPRSRRSPSIRRLRRRPGLRRPRRRDGAPRGAPGPELRPGRGGAAC